MRNSIIIAVSVLFAASISVPAGAFPHVDYVRSEIPSRYSGDVEKFCLRGYVSIIGCLCFLGRVCGR